MKNFPVDLVYLWVDGNDPKWQEEKNDWMRREKCVDQSTLACRFIDNQELKYSLRSVLKFAPWINNIFIITNGQVPEWLESTATSRVRIVKHNQIMPAMALPTFNSEAIETCICNIPDLSEHFLLANDDYFFFKETRKSYFFTDDGRPIYRLVKHNWSEEKVCHNRYRRNIYYSAKLVEKLTGKFYRYESSHTFDPCRKSYFLDCRKVFEGEFEKTANRKFRTDDSVQKIILAYHALATGRAELIEVPKTGFYARNNLYIELRTIEEAKDLLNYVQPFAFCLNDNEKTSVNVREQIKYFLAAIYPEKLNFEREVASMDGISDCTSAKPFRKHWKYYLYSLLSKITLGRTRIKLKLKKWKYVKTE